MRILVTGGAGNIGGSLCRELVRNDNCNEDITVYGDGNQTRTFCYISDNVQTTG